MQLNKQQELFCQQYIIDFNGSQAAIRAGYSENSSRSIASELLTKPNIKNRIEELKQDIFAAVGITQGKVYRELARLALSDVRELFDEQGALKSIHDISDNAASAISSVESIDERNSEGEFIGTVRKVKLSDKLNAIAQLVKIGGWSAPDKVINYTVEPTAEEAANIKQAFDKSL